MSTVLIETSRAACWTVAAMVAAAVVAGCHPTRDYQPPRAWGEDCQQDSVLIVFHRDSSHGPLDTVTAADMPWTKRIANLPEFHDCQRFVVDSTRAAGGRPGKLSFGPLVAIWAVDSLEYRFASSPSTPSLALPIATVYAGESGPGYAPLGISPGFNCLFLWRDGSTPPKWRAAMVRAPSGPGECGDAKTPEDVHGRPLQVEVAPLPGGLEASDIPPVARWDWDSTTNQQYIDIRCGDQSCQVGAAGFKPAPPSLPMGMTLAEFKALPGMSGQPNEVLRVAAVKGWFDEQQMDLPGTPPQLTNIIGRAIPHPRLHDASYPEDAWTTVGYLVVSDDYPGTIRLHRGVNQLQMCKGGPKRCGAPAGKTCTPKDQDAADPWWGRVIDPAGAAGEVRCVRRRTHGGEAGVIPAAAARWNWNELDAKTWVQCGTACCTVN